jgi:hypothetical protein
MLIPFDPGKHTEMIANLHFDALSWSTNSQLGREHILKIYKGLAELKSTFGFVWIHEGKLVGYVLGSTDYVEARDKIRAVYSRGDIFSLILKSFKKPLYFFNAFETVFVIPKYLKKLGTKAEWIAWNTDKSHPKQRTASIQCYYALKKYYAAHGYTHFIAQGERRSKESEAYLYADKSIEKKMFFQNIIYVIRLKTKNDGR